MTHLFLVSLYVFICLGFVVGYLINNDAISNAVKVLMTIFSPIVAPLILGVGMGVIIFAKAKETIEKQEL